MCNPYLTTDASMATNVEDKPDKRPPQNTKTRKVTKQNKTKKSQTGCISSWKFRADKILGAILTGYFYIDNKKICSKNG